jgi:hypothetical protein
MMYFEKAAELLPDSLALSSRVAWERARPAGNTG